MPLPRATVGAPINAPDYNTMIDAVDDLYLPAFWADSAGTQSIANAATGDGTTLTNFTSATSREWVGTVLTAGIATIPISGWYRITIAAVMASAGTDNRLLSGFVGATRTFATQLASGGQFITSSSVIRLTAGDTIRATMRQNSGAAINANSFQFSAICEAAL